MEFLTSGLGRYITQATLDSVIIAIAVEVMVVLWRVHEPSRLIALRSLVLVLPVIYLPWLFLVSFRNGDYFRQHTAIMDYSQWLGLRLGAGITLGHIFLIALGASTVYFIGWELVPGIAHYFGRRRVLPAIEKGRFAKLDRALAELAGRYTEALPEFRLSVEAVPVIYTTGRRQVVISRSAITLLDDDELTAVIGHELAHLTRRAYFVTQFALFLRIILFYNPVALLYLRRIIDDSEKFCDDISCRLACRPTALASGLLKVFRHGTTANKEPSPGPLPRRIGGLERTAHTGLIKARAVRLLSPESRGIVPCTDASIILTAVLLAVLLFFVV